MLHAAVVQLWERAPTVRGTRTALQREAAILPPDRAITATVPTVRLIGNLLQVPTTQAEIATITTTAMVPRVAAQEIRIPHLRHVPLQHRPVGIQVVMALQEPAHLALQTQQERHHRLQHHQDKPTAHRLPIQRIHRAVRHQVHLIHHPRVQVQVQAPAQVPIQAAPAAVVAAAAVLSVVDAGNIKYRFV